MFDFITPELIGVILGVNALLIGLHKALEYFKDKTSSNVDNAIYDFISKVLGYLQKFIEIFVSISVKKPEDAKKEEPKEPTESNPV